MSDEKKKLLSEVDKELAQRYGGFTSYPSAAAPAFVEYYGENPAVEVDRLLDLYTTPESCILDVGCGAGQTLCRLAAKAKQVWGIDHSAELLHATQLRAEHLGLTNVTLVHGNSVNPAEMASLPAAMFDLALTRRGPNLNAHLIQTLREGAFVVQELVSNFDGYPLREIFGRRPYAPYNYTDQQVILSNYAEQGLFPVSCKEYFYEEFFRDAEHLEQHLMQVVSMLSNWRLSPKPYIPAIDRTALDLYARYHTTSQGLRVLRQRKIFVLRKTVVSYYPVDATSATSEK